LSESPEELVLGLVGKKAWGVVNGYGSMLALDFGQPGTPNPQTKVVHGEYHLWLKDCAWRAEHMAGIDVGSGDDLPSTRHKLSALEDRTVVGAVVARPGLELTLAFDGGYALRVFPYLSEDDVDHWVLFVPGDRVLVVGPGISWRTEASRAPG
jgi:hypothetical protein